MIGVLRFLFEMTVISSVMIFVVLYIRSIFAKKMNPIVISALWLMVLIRLCLPIMLESPVHLDSFIKSPASKQEIEQPYNAEEIAPLPFSNNVSSRNTLDTVQDITPATATQAATEQYGLSALYKQILVFFEGISIWSLIAIVWVAGMVFISLVTIKKMAVFKRKVLKSSHVASNEILDIVFEHKKRLKIKRNIQVIECRHIDIPIIMGYFKPYLLLPTSVSKSMSKRKISHILLHELCHIKRHDLLVNYVWVIAKTIHWFNPFVWIACKLYQNDMEICCDQRVLHELSGDKFEYSQSLIDVARISKRNGTLPIAIAFCDKKSKLSERINRMIMPEKKSKSAVVISIVLALVMGIACFTTACQPTPDDVIVRNKGNDTLFDMISNANIDNQYDDFATIDTVTEHIVNEKLNVEITIDANVLIPNVSTVPVHTYEYRQFSQDDIDNIVSVLCKGKQLYEINEELTVDEIDEKIIYYKKKLSEATGANESISNSGATPFSPKEISKIIKTYEDLKRTAPTEIQLIPALFILPSDNESYYLAGQTDATSNERETISIFSSLETGTQITYYNPSFLRHSYKEFIDIIPEGLTITEQEAIEQAQQLLNDLGETQMQLCSIVADESVLQSELSLIQNDNTLSPYYQLTFIRSINDMPSTYEYRYFTNDENAESVYYERIYIYVNDDGIVAFEWNSPLAHKDVLNSNVGLMEFDKILQEAKKNLPLMVSKDINGKKDSTIINIDTIRLGYMQVKMKNRRNEFMFIPVWDFFGTSKQHYTEMIPGWTIDEDGWLSLNNLAESYITINAVDGSVIDRDLGY